MLAAEVALKGLRACIDSKFQCAVVRELSIMTVGQPLQDIALVDLPSQQSGSDSQARQSSGPQHCVLLRAGGLLSLLDIELGMNMCPLSACLAYLVPIKTL